MITVTKKFSFCYGHRLPGYDGKCADFHGHNAEVEVEIAGWDENGYPTMVIDFSKLKAIVNGLLLELDHKDLTEFFVTGPLAFCAGRFRKETDGSYYRPATAETICGWLTQNIEAALPDGCRLERLRVTETPDSWAEYKAHVFIDGRTK